MPTTLPSARVAPSTSTTTDYDNNDNVVDIDNYCYVVSCSYFFGCCSVKREALLQVCSGDNDQNDVGDDDDDDDDEGNADADADGDDDDEL